MPTGLSLLVLASLAAQGKSDDAAFRRLLTAEYAAIARGDTLELGRLLSTDLAWVVGPTGEEIGRATLLAGVARVQSPAPQFTIDQVRARVIGSVAVVGYVRADRRAVGRYSVITRSRCQDVFSREGDRWRLERHSQTWIVTPVNPGAEPATAADFVGRYRIADDYIDDVHREGARLVATASGQASGATLVPVSTNAFSPDGVGALIVFERDRAGRVTGYVQGYPDGRVVRAARLP